MCPYLGTTTVLYPAVLELWTLLLHAYLDAEMGEVQVEVASWKSSGAARGKQLRYSYGYLDGN